jgi:hypothetical protein
VGHAARMKETEKNTKDHFGAIGVDKMMMLILISIK